MTQPESLIVHRIMRHLKDAHPKSLWWKTHGNQYSGRGWPDIVGMIDGRFVGIEVKMPGKKLRPLQVWRLETIRQAGGIGIGVHSVEEVRDCLGNLLRSRTTRQVDR